MFAIKSLLNKNMFMKLGDLSYNDAKKYLKNNKSIIIPIGSTEQHSKALPLSTDTLIAKKIAEKISEKKNWLMGPTINIGYSDVPQPFMKFAGTITYQANTLISIIKDYISSLYLHGFRDVYIINAHGGNNKFIKKAVGELNNNLNEINIYLHNWWTINVIQNYCKQIDKNSMNHAGTIESALALYLFEDKVRKNQFTKEFKYINTTTGIIDSDQTLATKKMGKEIFELIINESLNIINQNKEKFLIKQTVPYKK
jgi:creatinine amidohydrolase